MGLPYELFLALRYLRFHRGRTFLSVITVISVAGVTVGTGALVIALSLMAGFLEDVRERIHSGSAHLTVMSIEGPTFGAVDRTVGDTRAVPGVQAAAPVLYSPAMIMAEHGNPAYAELQGIDPGQHARVILEPDAADDPYADLGRETASGRDAILLGAELADKLGVVTGDMVRVVVPRVTLTPWSPMPRSSVFEVAGTYRSDHFMEDSQRAYLGLKPTRRLLRAPEQASWIEVRLDDLRHVDSMKRELQLALGGPWVVVDLIEQNQDLFKALNTEKLMLFLAIGLIVVVASLNIVSTLILMVTGKIKEIGTLSAMGARPAGIARVFIFQGLIIGVLGTTLGVALGTGISIWLDRFRIIRLNPEVYYLTHLPFAPQPFDLIVIAVAAVLVSLLATIYPALKAASLDPVEAIRYE